MKKIFALLFLCISFVSFAQTTAPVRQKIIYHADAGMNIGILAIRKTNNLQNSPRIGFNAGLYVDFPVGQQVYLETGVHYSQQGGAFSQATTGYSGNYYYQKENIKLDYIQVPLLIKAITQTQWFAAGGFCFSTIAGFSDRWEFKQTSYSAMPADTMGSGTTVEITSNTNIQKHEMGGIVVFGRYFKNGLGISVNYDMTVIGTYQKSNSSAGYHSYNSYYYHSPFTNSAVDIDITYKFGGKSK
jgi:hypothetical protein